MILGIPWHLIKRKDEEPEMEKTELTTTVTRTRKIKMRRSKLLELIAADTQCEIPDKADVWANGYVSFAHLTGDDDSITVSWDEEVEC